MQLDLQLSFDSKQIDDIRSDVYLSEVITLDSKLHQGSDCTFSQSFHSTPPPLALICCKMVYLHRAILKVRLDFIITLKLLSREFYSFPRELTISSLV